MTKAANEVLTEALALTPQERMDLAAELLASVDGPADPDWEPAWCERHEQCTARGVG